MESTGLDPDKLEARTSSTHCVPCGHRSPGHYPDCRNYRAGAPGSSSQFDDDPDTPALDPALFDPDTGCPVCQPGVVNGKLIDHTCGLW